MGISANRKRAIRAQVAERVEHAVKSLVIDLSRYEPGREDFIDEVYSDLDEKTLHSEVVPDGVIDSAIESTANWFDIMVYPKE